jgi:bifunctional DNA-binding transcriptional regulator/antitoxin component of YhaV-PrlF toxin-antitoxin module
MSQTCHAEVHGDGRVTIDALLRRRLGLEKGDLVELQVTPVNETDDGEVTAG